MCDKCGCTNPWRGAGPDLRKVDKLKIDFEKEEENNMRCPKCNGKVEMMVDVTMIIPAELESQLTKTNLRRKDVRIYAANWSKASYFCLNENCRWSQPVKNQF
jgi:hypothetical protein